MAAKGGGGTTQAGPSRGRTPRSRSAPRGTASGKQLYVSPPLSPVLTAPSPRVVAIGGLDPGGGAGLARDLVTARALGAVVDLIGTAWTEQSPRGVRGFELRASGGVAAAV